VARDEVAPRVCPATTDLEVAAAPEIAPVVADVARLLSSGPEGSCPTVTVSSEDPAAVVDAVAAGAVGPDVWIPDSSLSLKRLRTAGRAPQSDPTTRSPVVLAVSPVVAQQPGSRVQAGSPPCSALRRRSA